MLKPFCLLNALLIDYNERVSEGQIYLGLVKESILKLVDTSIDLFEYFIEKNPNTEILWELAEFFVACLRLCPDEFSELEKVQAVFLDCV